MLVLSRKVGEVIVIGSEGEITLTVLEVRGDRVRLGLVAPREVPIHRDRPLGEVIQEVWHAGLAAGGPGGVGGGRGGGGGPGGGPPAAEAPAAPGAPPPAGRIP